MCGEHFIISARGLGKTGSSPHVRGALSQLQCPCRWLGIIPACAGSTCCFRRRLGCTGDHPRMCGEHQTGVANTARYLGSSPHVRGARQMIKRCFCSHGIIPACAGSTSMHHAFINGRRDHPRMCGEHSVHEIGYWSLRGSSPHVRGAPTGCHGWVHQHGIIPACAGSTHCWRRWRSRERDHPRMCGEHATRHAGIRLRPGSSPHVRGAHPNGLPRR